MDTYNEFMLKRAGDEAEKLLHSPEALYAAVVQEAERHFGELVDLERSVTEDYKRRLVDAGAL